MGSAARHLSITGSLRAHATFIGVCLAYGCAQAPERPAPIEDGGTRAPEQAAIALPPPAAPADIKPEPQPGAISLPPGGLPGAMPKPVAPAPQPMPQNRAVSELIAKAEVSLDTRDLALARATLERGLKIAPDDPLIWHKLANVRFAEGEFAQARAMAERSIALAARDPSLRARNWRLIGAAESRLGNPEAAARAFEEAETSAAGL